MCLKYNLVISCIPVVISLNCLRLSSAVYKSIMINEREGFGEKSSSDLRKFGTNADDRVGSNWRWKGSIKQGKYNSKLQLDMIQLQRED